MNCWGRCLCGRRIWLPRRPRLLWLSYHALPDELAGRIAHMVRRVAVTIRTGYPCDGVTVRQNNEPAGGQDVWHLHTHVIPRHIGDGMYLGVPVRADDRARARYGGSPARASRGRTPPVMTKYQLITNLGKISN